MKIQANLFLVFYWVSCFLVKGASMANFPILSNKEKKELIDLANEAADRAREAILPYFRQNITVSNKDEHTFDPVTEADKAAENAIRKVISLSRPHDGIWGEETGELASLSLIHI